MANLFAQSRTLMVAGIKQSVKPACGLAVASTTPVEGDYETVVACHYGWKETVRAAARDEAVSEALRRFKAHKAGGSGNGQARQCG